MAMNAIYGRSRNGGLAPGVHFKEVVPQKRPEFQTGVPVFVGFGHAIGQADCECFSIGRTNIFRLTHMEQFEQCIMIDVFHGFLDYAIRGFFENGGESCVVVPLEEVGDNHKRVEALCKLFTDNNVLEDVENIDLVCVPDVMRPEIRKSSAAVAKLQQLMLTHCRKMGDRFAVLDGPPFEGSVEPDVKRKTGRHRGNMAEYFLEHIRKISPSGRPAEGAMYTPRISVKPLARHNDKDCVWVPPCGHVAGIYARSDRMIGVHKAPANEVVRGAIDLEIHVSDKDQAELNKFGLNCLRSFPGRGIRVWGARTLSSRPEWKYINIRRLILTLVRWSRHNLNDIVFEPNEPALWNRVKNRVGAYCYGLYKRGALKGRRPAEAFFVKCDAETNPLEAREAGQLICEVGLAPVVPAEFVVVRIVKNFSGTTATLPTNI